MRTRTSTIALPSTIIGRVIFALVTITLAVVGLFFLAFALVAVTVIAIIIGIRFWWLRRKIRAQQNSDVIEGSYSVESDKLLTVDRHTTTTDDKPSPPETPH
jgi:predicted lipid-binding transport protein (Tim44 family)